MMKKTILSMVLCTIIISPVKAIWSQYYWYSPDSWSKATVYFQAGWGEPDTDLNTVYVGGKGRLPNSNDNNSIKFPFSTYAKDYSWILPWRGSGDMSELNFPPLSTHPGRLKTTHVIVDSAITHIGDHWFERLSDLKEVSLSSTLESIGEGAFKSCGNLPSISIPDKVNNIGSNAFQYCSNLKYVTIPAGSTLGGAVFRSSGLESVVIGDNVSFGQQIFYDCKNLSSVTFQGRITEITCEMFRDCSSLKTLNLPNGLTAIGNYAFESCSSLSSINLPNSVTTIGDYAFYKSGITSMNLSNGLTAIGNSAFYETKLTSVTLPDNLTKIGSYAFERTGLTSIIIPGSVKEMGEYAFGYCGNLTSVKICEGIKTIGNSVFYGCEKLETVSLPASLDSIGQLAFSSCYNLRAIECAAMIPPVLNSDAFSRSTLTNATLYVPHGSVNAYRNAPVWKNFKNTGSYPAGIHIINGKNFIINTGEPVKLTAKLTPHDAASTIIWTTGNRKIAFVSDGTVTASAPGEAIITATTINGIIKDSCRITVKIGKAGLFHFLGKDDFQNSKHIIIPASSILDDNIFANNLSIETVVVGDNVHFGKYAFQNCKNLKSVTFQGRINEISESMFQTCNSLESINIPNGVTFIGDYAFYDCHNLQSVNIPNSVTSIGDYAFFDCYGLQTVTIPNSVTSIGSRTFAYCSGLQSVTIPNSVTSIGEYAFDKTDLVTLSVPGSVKNIKPGAFGYSKALTSVNLCEGVRLIGASNFASCEKLETVSLPASLDSIDMNAFGYGCNNLKIIECNATTPPALHSNAFIKSDLTNVMLYVPKESVNAYRNAPVWKNFPSIVASPPEGN
jgi:hypothetical protein